MALAVVSLRPVEAQAAVVNSGACGDNLTWTLDDTGTFTVSGTGNMWDFVNEECYDYHEKTWQGLEQNIKRVVFNSGITYIGALAFGEHKNLTQVTFVDSITAIGFCAFMGCTNLEDFTLPENLTYLGQQGFFGCEKITKVRIPDTVTFLAGSCFDNCSALTEVYIGGSADAGSYVYANTPLGFCPSLEKIEVSPDNFALTAVDNVLYSKDMKTVVEYPAGKKDKAYIVPETVETIWQFAVLLNPYIEEISFPESLRLIDVGGLNNCKNLKTIQFAASQTPITIGDSAFASCVSLESITLPDNVTTIDEYGFAWCDSLESITIPASVTTIGNKAFYWCESLKGIWVDTDNANYSNDSYGVLFDKNKTTLLQSPGGMTGNYMIPDSVTTIDKHAFAWNTGLTNVTIPNSVKTIGNSAFSYCWNLENVVIGNGVTTIEGSAFTNCYKLKSITLGESITTIGESAFYECVTLADVYYAGTEDQWNAINIGTDNLPLTSATIHYNCAQGEISSPTYTIKGGYISDIPAGTTVEALLAGINQRDEVQVFMGDEPISPDAVLTTGMTLKLIRGGNVIETLTIVVAGDLDGQGAVDNKDVEYLLWYTLFPESYPLAMSVDFNGDGRTDNKDVEYLLWYTLFPDSYPLIQ